MHEWPGGSMTVRLRGLSDRLKKALGKCAGVNLTPEDLDLALAALRAIASGIAREGVFNGGRATFQIELLDEEGWPKETLAVILDESVARQVFEIAAKGRPERRIVLRCGSKILAKHPSD
jgi:hypothetical protein